MKKKLILIGIIIIIILLSIFAYLYSKDNIRFKIDYEIYNNSEFSNGKTIPIKIQSDNKIKYVKEENIEKILTTGTSVVYFGYPTCPWCRNIVSLLIEVVNKSNIDTLYYVDAKKINTENIFDILEEYLEVDANNEKHLYVPDVYFIKNGEIIFHHLGTIDRYKNAFKGMNEEQIFELKSIYQHGIDMIGGKENE